MPVHVQLVVCLSEFYIALFCLLVAGYLKIKLKKEQVASNECRLLYHIASPTSGTFRA